MDYVQTVVVGAGVVGLAIARALAQRGRDVVVLEAAHAIGTGVSSRSSEVIHAGLYYPTGSLRARLCVRGRQQLYAYCATHGVAHRRCGKLVVATSQAQVPALQQVAERARANGVDDVQWLEGAQAALLEPALACVAALHSPSTGIIDSHGLMVALRGDAEAAGAMVAFGAPVTGAAVRAERGTDRIVLQVGGDEPMALACDEWINAAGLGACALALATRGWPAAVRWPQAHYARGNYFSMAARAPFSRLIYPVPEAAGLGVHLTLDLGGQARFGPDVEWLPQGAQADYRVNEARCAAFEAEIRRYWPALPSGALKPAYAGIRPKIHGPDTPAADFLIAGPAAHGVPGVVQLLGIESPGLTSCLAIAEHVCEALALNEGSGGR